jgi:hypothetical protein
LALLAFVYAGAQEKDKPVKETKFGSKLGMNLANLAGSDAGDANIIIGFNAGLFVEIPISDKFTFQPEILYSAQGSKSEGPLNVEGTIYNVEATLKFNYINIPLMFKYHVDKNFSLEAGPYVGFLASSKLKAKIEGLGTETIDMNDNLKSTDIGLGIGMNYEFSDVIFANARYQGGLTQIGDAASGGNNIKNSILQIGLGFRF